MLISIWNFLRGYVIIEVVGFSLERFLNLAAHRGIYIWDIKRQGNKLTLSVGIPGYKMLKQCARKTRCRIEIKRKTGLPFITYRYRRRKMVPIGFILFIMLIYTMTSFVWLVEVKGNENITTQEIIEKLAKSGYKTGELKYKMNLRHAEQLMMNNFSDILWTGIYFEGTKLMIEVVESVPEPPFIDYSTPTNIISKSDALIIDIVTRKGTPKVKRGDTVRKNDILVSGIVPIGEEGEVSYVRASADIIAKTHYRIQTQLQIKNIYKEYSGVFKTGYGLRLFDKKTNIYTPSIQFKNYDYVVSSKQFQVTSKFPLPFYLIKEEYIDYILKSEIISDEVAQDKLVVMLDNLLEKATDKDAKVIGKNIYFEKKDGIMIGTLQAIVEEELGNEVLLQNDDGRH